jgi:flagellar hook-associated protein 1 FlgK
MSQGLNSLLHTALDGLRAQSFGLQVTGQNITNVNTPGYARRDAQFETRGQGLNGLDVAGMRRITDAVIERRQFQSNGLAAAASEQDSQLARLEGLFDDAGGTGLADSLSALYSSFSGLANNPNDPTARANVLARAGQLTTRINDTADAIATGRADLFTKAQSVVADVNERAQQIAKLNQEIARVKAAGGDTANLEDQRQQVLLDLAPTLVRWEVLKDGILLLANPPDEWPKQRVRVMAEHADYAPAAERVARSVLRHLAGLGAP